MTKNKISVYYEVPLLFSFKITKRNMFEDRLHEIGFTKRESRVYLELLKLGPQAVSVLAKKSELNRTTAYSILKSLERKGVVSSYVNRGIKYFVANDPNCLVGYVDQKCKMFDHYRGEILKLIPQYRSLAGKYSFKKPVVRYFDGIEGIKRVITDVFTSNKDLLAILSFDDRWRNLELSEFMIGHVKKSIIADDKKVKLKIIMPDTNEVRAFLDQKLKIFFDIEDVLFIPSKNFNKMFENQIGIYDDKVAIVRLEKGEEYGIIIENKDIANTHREIFRMAWSGGNHIKKDSHEVKDSV